MPKPPQGTVVGEQLVTELEKGRRWRVIRTTNGLNVLDFEDYFGAINGTPCVFNGVNYPERALCIVDASFTNEGLPLHHWKQTIELLFNRQTWDRPQDGWSLQPLPFDRLQLPQ